jgi:hypothetical protein
LAIAAAGACEREAVGPDGRTVVEDRRHVHGSGCGSSSEGRSLPFQGCLRNKSSTRHSVEREFVLQEIIRAIAAIRLIFFLCGNAQDVSFYPDKIPCATAFAKNRIMRL